MALSTAGYQVGGTGQTSAGTAAANGNYLPITGAYATWNGATQYTNGTYFLSFVVAPGPSYSWNIANAANTNYNSGQTLYNVASTAAGTGIMPLTGWSTASLGTAPAPTLISMTPQVPINNAAYVSCPGTGAIAVASGAWEVRNAAGTLVDTGSSPGGDGANSLFNVGAPSASGSAVLVKALTGATIAQNYTFRSTYTSGSSSGPFDVVAAAVAVAGPTNMTVTIVY